VVIPSLIESFSLVLLESLRKNGVVICSDIEQFRYLAKDYLLFFQSKSVDDLAGKLSNIITDKELWLSIKKQSINFPFENYSWDKISLEYYTFYNKNVKQ
jgi:glycosyltransferase involved in cell wall biosynthesis